MRSQQSPSITALRLTQRIVRSLSFAGLAMLSTAACSSGVPDEPTTVDTRQPTPSVATSSATSVEATATAGPGRGSIALGGTFAELPVTFTMPVGWATDSGWLFKTDNYGRTSRESGMPYGFVFIDVANIYLDGCRWRLVDPPPGPAVDDLVSAYATVPGVGSTVSDITVDGYRGKLIEYTVPNYKADDCQDGRFGLLKEDGMPGDTPNVLAQAPNQRNQIRILDVEGSRLVILAGYPAGLSAKELAELEAIVDSMDIG